MPISVHRFFYSKGRGMRIILNGNPIELQKGLNIESLVVVRGLEPCRVVVELNGDITDSSNWEKILIKENDKIEIISFVGGG